MKIPPHQNTQLTNLGVGFRVDGQPVPITDTAMTAQVRKEVERKVEDRRIVREAKVLMRLGATPERIFEHVGQQVAASALT